MSERQGPQCEKRSTPNNPSVVTATSPPDSLIRNRPSGSPLPSTCIPTLQSTSDRGYWTGETYTEASIKVSLWVSTIETSDCAFITARRLPDLEFSNEPAPFSLPFASELEPPPFHTDNSCVLPWSDNRNSSGGSSHGSSSSESGDNNSNRNADSNNTTNRDNPNNNNNNAINITSSPILQPVPTIVIFDAELDLVLINLCNYYIDDADDVLNNLFNYNMITSFCQFRKTPPLDLGLWEIRRDDGLFTLIRCSVQLSLPNVIYYTSTLEDTTSNNPP